jgi:excisionase family DNA binding protein
MALALVTTEELRALLEQALDPLRAELARLRAQVEAQGVSIPEAAKRLGICERTVKRRIKDGTLPSTRVGGARRVLLSPVLEGDPPPPLATRGGER